MSEKEEKIKTIIELRTGKKLNVDDFNYADKQAPAKKLISTGKYIDVDGIIEVSKEQGIEILENERLELVKLREELEQREQKILIDEDTIRGEFGKIRIERQNLEIEKEEFEKSKKQLEETKSKKKVNK